VGDGIVYIVGAGPGDPGLITVQGLRRLRAADVVVYDRLVNPVLLEEAPPTAERIPVGKHAGGRFASQEEVNRLLIERAGSGRTVVRLKGGDPFVFSRGGEEAEALHAAGIRYEIVPGVTSAVAAPAYAGIPVTHRRHASAFAVVTGHEAQGTLDLDWEALARMPTLVVLMGLGRLREIVARLLACGMSPSVPAAVVTAGTTPHQRTVAGSLATIAARVQEAAIETPATLIVGEVVRLRDRLAWFERPAFLTKEQAPKADPDNLLVGEVGSSEVWRQR
jgi:uroporphyrin-III C-methyltransferase